MARTLLRGRVDPRGGRGLVAVALVVLGLWLGYFVVLAMIVEAIGLTLWLVDRRTTPKLRYLYLLTAPALLAALLLGFGFGYLAGGAFWGLYTAALTLGALAVSEFLGWRRWGRLRGDVAARSGE